MNEELFSVARIENGWLLTIRERHESDRQVFCGTWDEVATTCANVAFPYPNRCEPRGPKPWNWKAPEPAVAPRPAGERDDG